MNAELETSTIVNSTPHYAGATITSSENGVPMTNSFELLSGQTIAPSLTVAELGSNGPPTPLLAAILKRSDGTTVHTHNCVWGSNSVGTISLSPGTYQWYYSADVTAGGGFNGYRLDITTDYIGEIKGSTIFHTSFEEYGESNADARTGRKVWTGVYSLTLPATNGDYALSYWIKTGEGPWTLFEQTVTVTSGAVESLIIGDSGSVIDEVRLCPVGAVMTTYTHDPLVGTTSMTDTNNITSKYEYDGLGRLTTIRDNEENIVKHFNYHYQNQE
jgi:YD repeat-containing protein